MYIASYNIPNGQHVVLLLRKKREVGVACRIFCFTKTQ